MNRGHRKRVRNCLAGRIQPSRVGECTGYLIYNFSKREPTYLKRISGRESPLSLPQDFMKQYNLITRCDTANFGQRRRVSHDTPSTKPFPWHATPCTPCIKGPSSRTPQIPNSILMIKTTNLSISLSAENSLRTYAI